MSKPKTTVCKRCGKEVLSALWLTHLNSDECEKLILRKKNKDLQDQLTKSENQESTGMDCTIDQMLSKDVAVKWGLDEHGHKRNVQHIFMRCCQAISDLEDEARWIPVEESMPTEEKVYEVLDIVRDTVGFSLFQKPAWDNPWRSTTSLGEIRTITHWRNFTTPKM